MKNTLILLSSLLISLAAPNATHASVLPTGAGPAAPFTLELEGHVLWPARNDAAIPGDTGTKFSLNDILGSSAAGFRLEPTWQLSEKHQLRGVFAPLRIKNTGRLSQAVDFQGSTFNAGQDTEAIYQFNSYRVTYRYTFLSEGEWMILGGLTVKVRDAVISLRQGSTFQEKANLGPVPLLHLAGAYKITESLSGELEFDALAAPQGRAEDVRLGIRKTFTPGLSAIAGYRILEGGADNKEVFTFSTFHYAFIALGYEF